MVKILIKNVHLSINQCIAKFIKFIIQYKLIFEYLFIKIGKFSDQFGRASVPAHSHNFPLDVRVCWLSTGRVCIWTVAFQVGSWLLLIVVLFSTYFLVFYYLHININIIVLLFLTSFSIDLFFNCTFPRKAFLLMYGPDDNLLILKCFNKWVWVWVW